MTGPVEAGVQVAGSVVDSLKAQPLSLALVVMNITLLGFFFYIANVVAETRKREVAMMYEAQKEVREILQKCIVPPPRTELQNRAELPPLNLWPPLPLSRPPEADHDQP